MMLEALKEIPGYKAILKAVLRQQIQQLVSQLSTFNTNFKIIGSVKCKLGNKLTLNGYIDLYQLGKSVTMSCHDLILFWCLFSLFLCTHFSNIELFETVL